MAGSKAATGIAVKIFVKEHKISPMWIGREARIVTIAGTLAVGIREEDTGQAGTSSRATWRRFSIRPEPVGHSTCRLSP